LSVPLNVIKQVVVNGVLLLVYAPQQEVLVHQPLAVPPIQAVVHVHQVFPPVVDGVQVQIHVLIPDHHHHVVVASSPIVGVP